MLSKLTLIGMNNYSDGAIWDNLELPEGYDKEVVLAEILRQGGEFSVLYPDIDYVRYMIGIWSKKFYHNFERWITAFNFEYEALYNVDVTTTTTDAAKDTDNEKKNFDMKRWNTSNEKSDIKADGKNNKLSKTDKAAYDASSFQPLSQNSDSAVSSLSTSENHSLSTSESELHSESNSHSWEHSQTITEIKQGNQGITMSQEMLLAEYNAWRNNIYVMVAELFVSEFCICIYQ